MVALKPFRALHYDPAVVGDLAAVIAPPYDVIGPAQLARLYDRSPYNVVRVDLNREADRYAAAAAQFAAWRARGVVVQDRAPCLYYYVQDFALPAGGRRERSGVMAAVRLESFTEGNIRPHERTFARAKEDRLCLLSACRANLSPIFGLYANRTEAQAPVRALSQRETPWVDVTDETGQRHRLWRVTSPAVVEHVQQFLRDATIFIADGHHRYEAALAYRDRRRAEGDADAEADYNFALMYLTSMDDPGLVVLPTHRIWRGSFPDGSAAVREALFAHFDGRDFSDTVAGERELLTQLDAESAPGCLGLRLAGTERLWLLRLRCPAVLDEELSEFDPAVRYLDVTILDAFVLRRLLGIDCSRVAPDGLLTYTHDAAEALAAVRSEGAGAAFLVRPPRVREIEAVCLSGQVMPEKSTYFYPKLLTGLVFYLLGS